MLRTMTWTTLSFLLVTGCGPGDHQVGGGLELAFARQAQEGACPEEPTDTPAPPSLDAIEITLVRESGEIHHRTRVTVDADTSISVAGIPRGEALTLRVAGLVDDQIAWSGAVEGLTIRPGKNTRTRVFMTRVEAVSCSRRPLHVARALGATVALDDGRVLIAGGIEHIRTGACGDGCDAMLAGASVDVFDPRTGGIYPAARLHTPRALATATLLADGRVLVVGGTRRLTTGAVSGFPFAIDEQDVVDSFEVYLPDEDIWIEKPLPEGRVLHTATALEDGRVLVTGGGTGLHVDQALDTALLFDPSGESVGDFVSAQGRMATPRLGHTATLMFNGKVLIVGGALITTVAPVEEFSLSGEGGVFTAKQITGAPVNLFFHHVLPIPQRPEDELLVAGGSIFDGIDSLLPPSNENARVLRRLAQSDSESVETEDPMGYARLLHRMLPLGDETVLLAGGFTDLDLTPLDTMEVYHPASGGFGLPAGDAAMSVARGGHAVMPVSGGRALMAGGIGPSGLLGSAELYTPAPGE